MNWCLDVLPFVRGCSKTGSFRTFEIQIVIVVMKVMKVMSRGRQGVLLNCNFKMMCERPPPLASLASPPHEGETTPASVTGRAAEGGGGSLTRHLELELGNTPVSPARGYILPPLPRL